MFISGADQWNKVASCGDMYIYLQQVSPGQLGRKLDRWLNLLPVTSSPAAKSKRSQFWPQNYLQYLHPPSYYLPSYLPTYLHAKSFRTTNAKAN